MVTYLLRPKAGTIPMRGGSHRGFLVDVLYLVSALSYSEIWILLQRPIDKWNQLEWRLYSMSKSWFEVFCVFVNTGFYLRILNSILCNWIDISPLASWDSGNISGFPMEAISVLENVKLFLVVLEFFGNCTRLVYKPIALVSQDGLIIIFSLLIIIGLWHWLEQLSWFNG